MRKQQGGGVRVRGFLALPPRERSESMRTAGARPITKVEYAFYASLIVGVLTFAYQWTTGHPPSAAAVDALQNLLLTLLPVLVAYLTRPRPGDAPMEERPLSDAPPTL